MFTSSAMAPTATAVDAATVAANIIAVRLPDRFCSAIFLLPRMPHTVVTANAGRHILFAVGVRRDGVHNLLMTMQARRLCNPPIDFAHLNVIRKLARSEFEGVPEAIIRFRPILREK